MSKCWKQEKTNWKCLGSSSQDSAQSRSTGLSGGAPDSVRCARLARANSLLSGFHRRCTAIIHRTVRCAPDCPVCTGLSGEPTVGRANGRPGQRSAARSVQDTWPSQRSGGCTGLSGVHRTVSGAPTAPRRQRSASPNKERDPHRTVSGGTPDCPVRQATEGKNCLPGLLSTAPSCLGAIKGTPRCMEEIHKHSLSTLDHSHSVLAHLFDILVI
jgi:hypothetical protein